MTYRVITLPTIEPILLEEAKSQCRVDIDDDDAYIESLIGAARLYCEKIDWRSYLTQTIELWLDRWPDDAEISIPRPPLQSVSKIEYYNTSDTVATFAATSYFVDVVSEPGRVALRYNKPWPSTTLRPTNAICVTYVAGWTAAALVPKTIKQAMLLLIGHWYENRESTTVGAVSRAIEFGVMALLGIDRVFRF